MWASCSLSYGHVVEDVGVESRRRRRSPRGERRAPPGRLRLEQPREPIVAGARQERTARVAPSPGPVPVSSAYPVPGKAEGRVLVQADVEDVRVGLERVLDAVAVVRVEVETSSRRRACAFCQWRAAMTTLLTKAEAEGRRALGVVARGGAPRRRRAGALPASIGIDGAVPAPAAVSAAGTRPRRSGCRGGRTTPGPRAPASSKRSRYSLVVGSRRVVPADGGGVLLDQRRPEAGRCAPARTPRMTRSRVPPGARPRLRWCITHEDEQSRCHAYEAKVSPGPAGVADGTASGTNEPPPYARRHSDRSEVAWNRAGRARDECWPRRTSCTSRGPTPSGAASRWQCAHLRRPSTHVDSAAGLVRPRRGRSSAPVRG